MNNNVDSITLDDHELEIVQEASRAKNFVFDPNKKQYTIEELWNIGIVREAYSLQELDERHFTSTGVVTSFDEAAKRAETELQVGVPFAKSAKKWQLPIPLAGFRVVTTVFPPNTTVLPHIHPVIDQDTKGGGFRMVVRGSITFQDRKYMPGDWFFIPNGIPYSFSTDPHEESEENYWYDYTRYGKMVRISNPKATG